MTKSLNLSPLKAGEYLKKNTRVVYWLALLVLFLMEAWAIKNSVGIILRSKDEPVGIKKAQGARVDFTGYDQAMGRINGWANYKSATSTIISPFDPDNK